MKHIKWWLLFLAMAAVVGVLSAPPARADNAVSIDQVNGDGSSVVVYQEGSNNTTQLKIGGDNNTASVTQYDSTFAKIDLNGSNNYVALMQSGSATTPQTVETNISGNYNTLNATQTGNANQYMSATFSGNNNTVTASQSGTASHSLTATLTGNGNSLLSSQLGSTSNSATVNLTNAGGPSSLDLQQTGGNTLNFTQSCTNPSGCATVIRQ